MAKKNKSVTWSLLLNAFIFIGLMGLTLWFVFKDQDLNQVLGVMGSANPFFLILGVLCMLGYFSMEAWNVQTLLNSFGEKVSFFNALKYTSIGFFFCSVTPGASGGQPLEIYYMAKEGISTANATLSILIQTCGVQFAVTGLGLICAILGNDFLSGQVAILFAIGLVINVFALIVLLLCIFFTGGLKSILRHFFGFLWRHGFKKADSWLQKAEAGLDKYNEGSRYIRTHKKEFWTSIAKVVGQMSFYYLIPFFVYLSFGLTKETVFSIFTMQSILFVATCCLPIPGAIGASEAVFLTLYGTVFGESMVSSAMLLNRGISFYFFVLVTMVIVFINIITKGRMRFGHKRKK